MDQAVNIITLYLPQSYTLLWWLYGGGAYESKSNLMLVRKERNMQMLVVGGDWLMRFWEEVCTSVLMGCILGEVKLDILQMFWWFEKHGSFFTWVKVNIERVKAIGPADLLVTCNSRKHCKWTWMQGGVGMWILNQGWKKVPLLFDKGVVVIVGKAMEQKRVGLYKGSILDLVNLSICDTAEGSYLLPQAWLSRCNNTLDKNLGCWCWEQLDLWRKDCEMMFVRIQVTICTIMEGYIRHRHGGGRREMQHRRKMVFIARYSHPPPNDTPPPFDTLLTSYYVTQYCTDFYETNCNR